MARKKYSFGHEALGEIKEKAEEETSRFNGLVGLGGAEVGRGGYEGASKVSLREEGR